MKRFKLILLFLAVSCCYQADAQQAVLLGKGRIVLEPFAYGAVQLTGGSLRRQVDNVKAYYLAIPNDDLLKGFRLRMHFPTLGATDLGGWYTRDEFHVFGQIIGGLSRLYAVTGDEACRDKVNALIEGWAQCIDSTGYFFYSNKPNAPHYEYEKIVGGLLDAYQFAGNRKVLDYLSRITDWSIKNLTRDHRFAGEWYTLTQNLYRAYLITHDRKYLDFGNEWEYHSYWDALKDKKDPLQAGAHYMDNPHAYSHLNTLSSAAEAYLVKGSEGYKKTITNGYDFFTNEQCFVTGGYGLTEFLRNKTDQINTLRTTHKSFETQCGSWAAFKLCKYLLMIDGNGRYGDWIEKLMINGIGASIPMSADGKVLYYSDYNPREGIKQHYDEGWSCCTGTRPEAIAEYADLVYFKTADGIYVNVFTPSTVTWNGITFNQQTRFPESDETTFTISTAKPKSFSFHFRKPSWLKVLPQVWVNGQPVTATLSDGWYQVKRQWKNNDQIKLVLPMDFAISRLDTTKQYPAAITYGPVVLAVRSGDDPYPADLLDNPKPWENFIPVPGAVLNYHVKNKPGLLIRPYYEFKAGEPYILYIDPAVKNEVRYTHITTTGNWHGQGQFSDEAGATLTAVFTGNSIKFKGMQFDNAGRCEVSIDGKKAGTLDEYGPMSGLPFEHTFENLGEGKHTITLTVLPDKNSASKGNYVNYVGFEKPE